MRSVRQFIAAGLGVWAAGCSPTGEWKAEQRDRILEAVFRYEFENNGSAVKTAAAAYCLEVVSESGEVSAPSPQLLGRFTRHHPPVSSRDACRADHVAVYDGKSSQPALVFSAGPVRWLRRGKVEVRGGYYEANLSASDNRYTVILSEGQWMVVKDVLVGVS